MIYENSIYGIRIQHPQNWETIPANGPLGEVVFFTSQGVNQTRDQVEVDISVIPSRNMSLGELVQKEIEASKVLFPSRISYGAYNRPYNRLDV